MARLMQTSDLKERVYSQAVVFFSTNETTLTAINATVNSMMGLNEGTKNLNAMKDGINQSIEMLSTLGDTAQLEAVKAGYGPTLKVESIQKLVDSIVDFQGKSVTLIAEMRKLATENAQKIEEVVQEGQAKYAKLINTQI